MDNICVSVPWKWFCREGELRVGWAAVAAAAAGGRRQRLQAKSLAVGAGGGWQRR